MRIWRHTCAVCGKNLKANYKLCWEHRDSTPEETPDASKYGVGHSGADEAFKD